MLSFSNCIRYHRVSKSKPFPFILGGDLHISSTLVLERDQKINGEGYWGRNNIKNKNKYIDLEVCRNKCISFFGCVVCWPFYVLHSNWFVMGNRNVRWKKVQHGNEKKSNVFGLHVYTCSCPSLEPFRHLDFWYKFSSTILPSSGSIVWNLPLFKGIYYSGFVILMQRVCTVRGQFQGMLWKS